MAGQSKIVIVVCNRHCDFNWRLVKHTWPCGGERKYRNTWQVPWSSIHAELGVILILKLKSCYTKSRFWFKSPSFKWFWFKITKEFVILILKTSQNQNHRKPVLWNLIKFRQMAKIAKKFCCILKKCPQTIPSPNFFGGLSAPEPPTLKGGPEGVRNWLFLFLLQNDLYW